MSYVVRKRNGQKFIVLADQEVNGDYSITFTGRNVNSYGEIQQDNFLWLMENFASDTEPTNPVVGQLWFNTAQHSLQVYEGSSSSESNGGWSKLYKTTSSSTEPKYPTTGETWYDTEYNVLKVYNDQAEWQIVGPSLPVNQLLIKGTNVYTDANTPDVGVNLIANIPADSIKGSSVIKATIIARTKTSASSTGYSAMWVEEGLIVVSDFESRVLGTVNRVSRISSDDSILGPDGSAHWNVGDFIIELDAEEEVVRLMVNVKGQHPDGNDEKVFWSLNIEAIVNNYETGD